MSHYLDSNNLVVTGYLKIDQATQQDDYVLVSGTAGDVSWKPKSTVIPNTSYDHYVGEMYAGGIVTAVWKEGNTEKCLIAATQDVNFTEQYVYTPEFENVQYTSYRAGYLHPWSNLTTNSGATWSSSGQLNTNIIMTQPGFDSTINPVFNDNQWLGFTYRTGYSGSANHCDLYQNPGTTIYGAYTDWFLPSAYEMSTFVNNLGIINKVLNQYATDTAYPTTDSATVLPSGKYAALINLPNNKSPRDPLGAGSGFDTYNVGWWTSTEASAGEAYAYLLQSGPDGPPNTMYLAPYPKTNFLLARPFRIQVG